MNEKNHYRANFYARNEGCVPTYVFTLEEISQEPSKCCCGKNPWSPLMIYFLANHALEPWRKVG